MTEVADTVDEALDRLSSPTTDDVDAATRGFSAREIATATASRTVAAVDPSAKWLGTALRRTLLAGTESFGIAVLGESTANDQTDWFYLFALRLAAINAAYGAKWRLFNDSTQDYAAPVTMVAPPLGDRYAQFAAGNNSLFLPATGAAQPLADMDISIDVALTDWTPSADQYLVCHYGAGGNRAFRFYVDTAGKLNLETSPDGATLLVHVSTAAPTVADGARLWVRAVYDSDNGASGHDVKFYTSVDGATWTQLGTTVTTATARAIFNSTYQWEIGGRNNASFSPDLKIYEVRVRSSILGQVILPTSPDQWQGPPAGVGGYGTAPTIGGSPILTVLGGAVGGQGIVYLSDATRIKLLLPDYALRAVFMATSHNDLEPATGGGRDKTYLASWTSWITAVKTNAYAATPVVVTENPRVSPAVNINDHAIRREILLALAARLAVPAVDAYQAFVDTGNVAAYIQADGIHPTVSGGADGAHLWANYAYKAVGLQ